MAPKMCTLFALLVTIAALFLIPNAQSVSNPDCRGESQGCRQDSDSSSLCCQTSIPNFVPWAGRCWGQQTSDSCNNVASGRCVWSDTDCPSDPPVNSLDPTKGCSMRDKPCAVDSDCCSEVCRINGSCR